MGAQCPPAPGFSSTIPSSIHSLNPSLHIELPLHKVTEKAKHAQARILSMLINLTEAKYQVTEHT